MNRYIPTPIDTSEVILSDEIEALTELLAHNTHEVWARQRITEGWKYGQKRDDQLLEHPGLVPYAELSEQEKQYDRNTAMETLKTITKIGWKLTK